MLKALRVVHASSFGAAVGVHAAVVLVLAVLLRADRRTDRVEELPPERLVWVEPAPLPLTGLGEAKGEGDREREVAAPAEPERPAIPQPRPRRAAPVKEARRPKPSVPAAPPRAESEQPTDANEERAPAAAKEAGRIDGAPGGVAGGATGGLGDAPLVLAAVARPPELLSRVVPEYPARARALAIEGQVLLEMVLDRDGRPEAEVRVVQSVPMLDAAAVAAVRQWRFRPARDAEGRPVRVIMQVPVRFELR